MIYHLDPDAGIVFGDNMPFLQMSINLLFDEAITTDEFAAAMTEEKRPVVLVFPYDDANEKYDNPIGISSMNCYPAYEEVDENTIYYLNYILNVNDINIVNDPPVKWYNGRIVVYNSLEKAYLVSNAELLPELSEDVIMQYAPWSEKTADISDEDEDLI